MISSREKAYISDLCLTGVQPTTLYVPSSRSSYGHRGLKPLVINSLEIQMVDNRNPSPFHQSRHRWTYHGTLRGNFMVGVESILTITVWSGNISGSCVHKSGQNRPKSKSRSSQPLSTGLETCTRCTDCLHRVFLAGRGHWDEDSVVSSPDGGSASDSGDRYQADHYRCIPQETSKIETLIRATQQMIKEEESRFQLRKGPPGGTLGPANGLPKGPGPCFTPEYLQGPLACRGLSQVISPAPSPAPLSRLSSPGPERLHKPKDYLHTDLSPLSLPLHHPFGHPGPCSDSPTPTPTLYPAHIHPRPYLDKHKAYSMTGYALENLYEPESLRGYCTSASSGPAHYDVTPHLRMPAEQTPGHKGTSVIISNGS